MDYKAFGLALVKGAAHAIAGKFDDLADDGIDTLSALGIEGKTPEALLYILLQQSMQSAITALLADSRDYLPEGIEANKLISALDASIVDTEIDITFFSSAQKMPLLVQVSDALVSWLTESGVQPSIATSIATRLPGFFPYALHREWQKNSSSYEPIRAQIHTPFTQAAVVEETWQTYSAKLQQRLNEGVFDEPFSLRQIYIPLNAFYEEQGDHGQKVVVKLEDELTQWLSYGNKEDAVKVVSGGPGSGKSSFAKVFAANVAASGVTKVLFVPLHLIDPNRDFVDEIGRFVRDEGILRHNPMAGDAEEANLLIVLDGLDELASQGKTAAITARNFIRTVQQTVDRRNLNALRLRILFSGREVVLQESESEFRRPKQILTVLPYFVGNRREYHDPGKLLAKDLRKSWWRNYGDLTGEAFKEGLPAELDRQDLVEITAQPLLNYLLALSFRRKKLDFATGVNLNQIYRDLAEAVYERGYEGRRHASVRDLSLDDFLLILEEIGLAAWHGDGRSTTVAEIEQHCIDGGLKSHLDVFQEGAKQGITQLLAAFFFRQHGERPKGDRTFVFTHKSFGEYLAARRFVHAMQDIADEMQRRENTGRGKGWSEADALAHWAKWTGPAALSSVIHKFVISEVELLPVAEVKSLHHHFTNLFNYILQFGLPIEKILLPTYHDAAFQARNAGESLLAALNACARVLQQVSAIEHPTPTAFGEWYKTIQGQRTGPANVIGASCLSWLNLSGVEVAYADFFGADLSNSLMRDIRARGATFERANLIGVNLKLAKLTLTNMRNANLKAACLDGADLNSANLNAAKFRDCKMSRVDLRGANLYGADFSGAELMEIEIEISDLENADFTKAATVGVLEPEEAKVKNAGRYRHPEALNRSNRVN
jgi:hypothetical protein